MVAIESVAAGVGVANNSLPVVFPGRLYKNLKGFV